MRKRFLLAATTLATVVPALAMAQARPAQPRPATPPAQQPRPAARPAQRPAPAPMPMMSTAEQKGSIELDIQPTSIIFRDQALYENVLVPAGTGTANRFSAGLQGRFGYHVSPKLAVGAGLGWGTFSDGVSAFQVLPGVSYTLKPDAKTSPLLTVQGVYTSISGNGSATGIGAEVGAGVRHFVSDNLAIRLDGRVGFQSINVTPSVSAITGAAGIGIAYFTGAKKVVTAVAVTPNMGTLTSSGATQRMAAEVRDQHGRPMMGKVITWSSSNPQVATVNAQGVVTAVGDGSAEIVATSEGVRGSSRVTVARAVNTVTVTPASASIDALGRTAQLSAAGKDAGNMAVANAQYTWASSNPAVATVSPMGQVTAVGTGTATITATANGKSASATVTVSQTVATVTVTPATASITVGATTQLSAAAADANSRPVSGKTFTWTSTTPTIATVSSTGLVTGVAAGAARITAMADNQTGASVVTVQSVAAPAAPPVELPRVGAALVLRNVTFVSNGTTLTPASKTILDPFASAIVGMPNSHWEIGGYTDNRGTAAANRRLSQRRAAAVMQYLISKGVPAGQLTAVGYGPANPTRPNTTAAGRAANRRVEIKRVN